MPLSDLFSSIPDPQAIGRTPSRRERAAASVALGCIAALVAAGVALRGVRVGLPPGAFILDTTLLWAGVVLTALLFHVRVWIVRDAAGATLAAAYTFAALMVTLTLCTERAMGLWTYPSAAVVASFLARVGILVGIACYAIERRAARRRLGAKLVAAVVAAGGAAWFALAGPAPPVASYGAHENVAASFGVYIAVLFALAAVVAALMLRRGPRFESLDLWLGVAVAAAIGFNLALIAGGGDRLSAGSVSARIISASFSYVVLGALVAELVRVFLRRGSVEQFVALADLAGTVVLLLDADGAALYVNRRWSEATGQAAAAALGDGWRERMHPDDAPLGQGEVRLRTQHGAERWYLMRTVPIRNAESELVGFYRKLIDIDDQRRARDEIERLYRREQHLSRSLQAAYEPSFLPDVPGVELAAHYRPASRDTQVGGDWCDAFELRDGRIALSIGDVFGHGLEAASVMIRLRESMRAVTGIIDDDPATILRAANRALRSSHPDAIATAALAFFDPSSGALVLSCAGHPPPIVLRDGSPMLLAYGGVPLGVDADSRFPVLELTLQPGDALFLYTDGLIEATRDIDAGERRLLDAVTAFPDDADAVIAAVLDGEASDDVALLRLRVAAVGAVLSWQFASDDAASAQDARSAFIAHLRRRSLGGEALSAAELVFGELVSNVVRHAPGPIELDLGWDGQTPVLAVRDRGRGFKPGIATLPSDPLAEDGRGLFLVAVFASPPVIVPRPGGGTEVVVRLATPALVPLAAAMV